jgi:hypothetical protein
MKTIRASEIGSYLYCKRAWHYARLGLEPENQADLAAGTLLHQRHGRKVFAGSCVQALAVLMLIAALGLFTFYLVTNLVG